MLKLLTKTTPWMVASFLVATSVSGQECSAPSKPAMKSEQPAAKPCAKPDCAPKACPKPCPQPCPPTQLCPQPPAACCPPWPMPVLNAAYNYPARTQVRCPWDVFFDASFIYWQPSEDNIAVGTVTSGLTAGTDPAATAVTSTKIVDMEFNYKPGFKVGMGGYFEYDNWDIHAEYTWFHNTNTKSASVAATAASTQAIQSYWNSASYYDAANAKWKLQMDLLDVDLGRWYYVGTKLTFRPSFGARAAWIHQRYFSNFQANSPFAYATYNAAPANQSTTTIVKSNSWGLGAKAGLETNWMIGSGFRVFGNGEADILFTRYTTLSNNQKIANLTTGAQVSQKITSDTNLNTVRTHLDLELGLGWGTYWDCNNWYTDLAIGYGFQVFFDQNMFNFDAQQSAGNLYVQGLDVTFSLTF